MGVMTTPAFAGSNFDSNGGCLRHPDVRLTQKMFTDEGKVVYKELMRRCPKCLIKLQQQQQEKLSNAQSSESSYLTKSQQGSAVDRSNSRSSNSYRWGASKSNTEMPESPSQNNNNPLARSASRSRSRVRSKSRDRDTTLPTSPLQNRSMSRPRQSVWGQVPSQRDNNSNSMSKRGGAGNEGSIATNDSNSNNLPTKKVFDSPFDSKGRCHFHPKISLAKKKLTGGWKVLLDSCPKCIEERYIQDSNNSDNRSVGSRRSTKSDNRSVSSRHSAQSDNSRNSNKPNHRSSVASSSRFATFSSAAVRSPSAPRSGGSKMKMKSADKTTMARYECPFDNQGCCRIHHHVRLAKKKLTGGWKVIQDLCPECDEEDNCSVDSRSSRFSRRSVASKGSQKLEGNSKTKSPAGVSGSKSFRRSTSSCAPDRGARNDVEFSTSQSDQMRTKLEKMHVKDDDNREDAIRRARIGGEWNEGTSIQGNSTREKPVTKDKQYREKRSSKISCTDVTRGSNASGAKCDSNKSDGVPNGEVDDIVTPRQRYPKEENAHYKQRALREYKDLYESAKVVKNMLFVDVHGDAGRYTGDVNEFRMPHGQGNIIYEHGLVQGGKWTNGVLDEGSMSSGGKSLSESRTSLSSNRVGVRSIDP